jgi:iron(III) transport system substrate-binding protein
MTWTGSGGGLGMARRAPRSGYERFMNASSRLLLTTLALIGSFSCSDGRAPLVIYSPHGRGLLTLAEQTFEAANPGVDVRWLDMGSQDVLDRVKSEQANPQADIWFGGPSNLFGRAAAESLLVAYRPSWADFIPARGRGAGDFYFASYETPAVIAYNSEAVTDDDVPSDWDEVLEPRWKGEILIRDPLASGTMRTIFGMIIQRGLRATGDTGAGFEWLRQLDAQTREYAINPALLHQKMIRQEGVLTLWGLPDILTEQRKGNPFDFVLPTSGTPVIEDAIAIVRGTQRLQLAQQFVEWVGSIEAQIMATRREFRLPARIDVPFDSLPGWAQRVRTELVAEPMDWDLLSERGAEWMFYWDRHVRGQG